MSDLYQNILEEEEDTQRGRFLTFSLEKERFGIEIRYVTEIIGIQEITEIPELPIFIKGIVNLRGQIIPVMDVRLRFRKQPQEYDDRTCVIVINVRDVSIGLIVDTVSDVVSISDEDIVEPPRLKGIFDNRYIKKVGMIQGKTYLILDCDKLFSGEELEELAEIK